jgi:hypothetical protein
MHSKKQKEIEGLQDTEMEMETDKRNRKKKGRTKFIERQTKGQRKKLIRGSSPPGCIVMLREGERERERERDHPPSLKC